MKNKIILLVIGLILFSGIVFAITEEFPSKESIPKEIKLESPLFLLIFFLSILILLIALLFIFRNKAVLLGGLAGGFIGISWTTILDSLAHYIKVPVTTDIAPDGYTRLSYYFNCGGGKCLEMFLFNFYLYSYMYFTRNINWIYNQERI